MPSQSRLSDENLNFIDALYEAKVTIEVHIMCKVDVDGEECGPVQSLKIPMRILTLGDVLILTSPTRSQGLGFHKVSYDSFFLVFFFGECGAQMESCEEFGWRLKYAMYYFPWKNEPSTPRSFNLRAVYVSSDSRTIVDNIYFSSLSYAVTTYKLETVL